ncbi:MAG: 50S ribosomal protein L25 [Parcubacteria group bacterium GW2011_GWC1_42_11]|uniref:Large ribosomal subunit protein bL25 n=1 Tax=Candidatus Nomurabacteria bacterium GW2011_GWC2_42_20 TaxID=1618756 RepID=A0A0G0ZG75_9BACT|nr:MAG: 50S ribosomal protein L25 [Parcubacteria group bacterium GW2011_GWC1_42_11]KKS47750.1 MAG: 50S ribosomal protein L25 [Candidatus Nomurabacteria bacterium GW2011_GWC2_42_20]KKT09387.1 MAG: 50S ribosomal protein L25 [Candidatus Nomurabacteria bacterium GW2011_GWB1_43_20]TAN36392.1 MAG: 50S ribosomal protein L25 [Patescibacteria group bacterium]HBH71644.1 50S ribosomal protein L25 [Candidatus Yonathbacteria bacterium]
MNIILKGEIRDPKKKLSAIRAEGFVPGVYYGHKEVATPCVFPMIAFKKAWKVAGESTVVTLEMPKGNVSALIHEVQVDPVKGQPIHVDFYALEKGQEVTVNIPLEFTGVSVAVKDLGGALVKVLHEVEVKGQPENLPHNFVIDISPLVTLDSQILADSIVLPKGITLVTGAGDVVAAIAVAKEEVEAPVMDIASIEVEKKGKKEEEPVEDK